jgi:hypothetical protein
MIVVDQKAVGEQWKNDIPVTAGKIDNVPPHQGFAAGQHDHRNAEFIRLGENVIPLIKGQLRVSLAVMHPRIAVGAREIAPAGEAGDQYGRHRSAVATALPFSCLEVLTQPKSSHLSDMGKPAFTEAAQK